MKLLIRAVAVCLLLCLIYCMPGVVAAAGYENYNTYDVPEQEKIEFLEKIEFSLSDAEMKQRAFSCFAVSEQGQIALCFNGDNAAINVYDADGIFLYGFQFVNGNSALAIFFEGETLSILWGKNDYIGSFDTEGNCLQFQGYRNTKSNSDSYHNDRYRPASGKAGDKQYFADKIGLATSYTRFAIEDEFGNETVIYDVTEEMRIQYAVIWSVIIGTTALVLFAKWKNKKEENSLTDSNN